MDFVKQYMDFSYTSLGIALVLCIAVSVGIYFGLTKMKDETDSENEETWRTSLYSALGGILVFITSLFVYKFYLKNKNDNDILLDPFPSKIKL